MKLIFLAYCDSYKGEIATFCFGCPQRFPPFMTADNLHQLIVLTVLLNVRSVIMEETQRKQWQFRVGPVSCVSWSVAALKWDTAELLLPTPQCYHTWLRGFSDREGCYSGEKICGAILLAVGMRPHDSLRKVVFGVAVWIQFESTLFGFCCQQRSSEWPWLRWMDVNN